MPDKGQHLLEEQVRSDKSANVVDKKQSTGNVATANGSCSPFILMFTLSFSPHPQMVHTLASNGANSIWEHSLLDPAQVQSGRRKANPQDKVQ